MRDSQEECTSTSNIAPLQSRKYDVMLTPTEEGSIIPKEQQTNHVALTNTKLGTSDNWIRYNRENMYNSLWNNAMVRFNDTFLNISFNQSCSVCDRLWTDSSLNDAPYESDHILQREFPE